MKTIYISDVIKYMNPNHIDMKLSTLHNKDLPKYSEEDCFLIHVYKLIFLVFYERLGITKGYREVGSGIFTDWMDNFFLTVLTFPNYIPNNDVEEWINYIHHVEQYKLYNTPSWGFKELIGPAKFLKLQRYKRDY